MTTFARPRRLPRSGAQLTAVLVLAALAVAGCTSAPVHRHSHGTVSVSRIPSTSASLDGRQTTIYLPPRAGGRSLPVIELLHEPLSGSSSWLHVSALKVIANIFAAAHRGIAPIIVMLSLRENEQPPNVRTGPGRRLEGATERFLVTDVPSYLRMHYDTSSAARDWTIAGLASDGTYAVTLALRHPGVFGNFADLSGRDGPADLSHRLASLLQHRRYPATYGWFEAGRDDQAALRTQGRLAASSRRAGATVHVSTVTGSNDWTAWRASLRGLLAWALDRAIFGACPCPTTQPPRPPPTAARSRSSKPSSRPSPAPSEASSPTSASRSS